MEYTIEQVAKETGVTRATLRYWEKVFEITPGRNEGNHRRYSEVDMKKLKRIKQLYEQNLTTRGVAEALRR